LLSNQFQTFTDTLSANGSQLGLRLLADGNGDWEVFAFRNIIITQPGEMAAAVSVDGAVSGNNLVLNWNHLPTNEEYAIYRHTTPYFTPPTGTLLDTLTAPTATYTDINAVAGGTPYFYVVQAVSNSTSTSADSNEVGLIPFSIVPGSP
jgi:hypothetical protein